MQEQPERGYTRRRFMKLGSGAAVATGAAGCLGGGHAGNATTTGGGASTSRTGTTGPAGTSGESATESDTPYSITMEPMGEVTFESVPETWMAYFSTYGDMGIALGQLDGLRGLVFAENWPLAFYDTIPGLNVDFGNVRQLESEGSIDKEVFYELDCDVHLMDPNFIARLDDSWKPRDFEAVATDVGPIVGNLIRRRNEDWHDYRYYTLYEAFEKIAGVFRERERYEAIKGIHDRFISDVRSRLPPADERPEIGLLSINSDFEGGSFYAYPIGEGNGKKQYRDLGIADAFADAIDGGYAEWDYEQIMEIDPDVLVFSFGFSHASREEFEARMEAMRSDPLGSQLSAVRNDRLYRGGTAYQGPILNLLQTEAAAKQFYPDVFGEWKGIDSLANADEQLFDHGKLADVVKGEF